MQEPLYKLVNSSTLDYAVQGSKDESSVMVAVLLTSASWFCCGVCIWVMRICYTKKQSYFKFSWSVSKQSVVGRPLQRNSEESEGLSMGRNSSFIRKSIVLPNIRESICKLMGISDPSQASNFDPANGDSPDDTQANWLAGTLKYSKILMEYAEGDRIKIVQKMRRLILPNEHTLIKQGTEGTDLYMLEQGMLDVFVDEKKVNTIFPGWAFGELGFLFNSLRSATCVTTKESIVWVLTRDQLEEVVYGAFHDMESDDMIAASKTYKFSTNLDDLMMNCFLEDAPIGNGTRLERCDSNVSHSESIGALPDIPCGTPRIKRVISGALLDEISQNHYVGMPEAVSETIQAFHTRHDSLTSIGSHSFLSPSITLNPRPSLKVAVNLPQLRKQMSTTGSPNASASAKRKSLSTSGSVAHNILRRNSLSVGRKSFVARRKSLSLSAPKSGRRTSILFNKSTASSLPKNKNFSGGLLALPDNHFGFQEQYDGITDSECAITVESFKIPLPRAVSDPRGSRNFSDEYKSENHFDGLHAPCTLYE